MDLSKRGLGASYLVGTGLMLMVLLLARLFGPVRGSGDLLITVPGMLLSGSLVGVGYWLIRGELDDGHIWSIARWSGLGIAVLTLVNGSLVSIVRLTGRATTAESVVLINGIAAGAVAGVVIGVALEFKKANERVERLNQRNAVLNRVLRHNLRNELNVLLGRISRLEERMEGRDVKEIRHVEEKATEIAQLSENARRMEKAFAHDELPKGPIDVAALVEQYVERARRTYPDADVEADLPERAEARANPLLGSAIDNLLENAIEHNDRSPTVRIAVDGPGSAATDRVRVRISDNGPGIPTDELAPLADGTERPLQHGSGMGLWLVKWLVDNFDGDLAFEENDPRGSVVTITLPAASGRGRLLPFSRSGVDAPAPSAD